MGLAHQDDGEPGSRILVKLGEGVELGKDLEAQKGCFVNEEHGSHLLAHSKLA
jgi:hypothetical protein